MGSGLFRASSFRALYCISKHKGLLFLKCPALNMEASFESLVEVSKSRHILNP